jgi:hypothetical protein
MTPLIPWVLLGFALGFALDWSWRRVTRPTPNFARAKLDQEDHR